MSFFFFFGFILSGTYLTLESLYFCCEGGIIVITWSILNWSMNKMEMVLLMDEYSLSFGGSVLMISGSVLCYSRGYMENEKYFLRFHLLLIVFVASMMVLIFSVNLVSMLLGWDGLGLTSYLLVVYFQSSKSSNAGMLTVLMNRVGDVLVILGISMSSIEGSSMFYLTSSFSGSSWGGLMWILIAASLTKSAQIPFSSWLPAAMAAPTPVSALVHSSTLVTAGVYLLIRFQVALSLSLFKFFILLLGTLTMVMAGLSALVETDMKKVVALSTLGQLGLMMSCLGLGMFNISFFHLLLHAYMKALLFMSIGNMIHLSNDYQDIRRASLSVSNSPLTGGMMLSSTAGLCGFPFLAGFYSKDLWLEASAGCFSGVWVLSLFYLGVLLTILYSVRVIYFLLVRSPESYSFTLEQDESVYQMSGMLSLWPLATSGGGAVAWAFFKSATTTFMPWEAKVFTIEFIIFWAVAHCLALAFLKKGQPSSWTMGRLWGLPAISSQALLCLTYTWASLLRKSVDLGEWNELTVIEPLTELKIFFLYGGLTRSFLKNLLFTIVLVVLAGAW